MRATAAIRMHGASRWHGRAHVRSYTIFRRQPWRAHAPRPISPRSGPQIGQTLGSLAGAPAGAARRTKPRAVAVRPAGSRIV